jgi:malate dehydrogenase (oxaloacetate-decarboxylating)(NADP+)
MDKQFREAALQYHRISPAGKISVTPSKPIQTQRDLALAYSPGVAAACDEIVRDQNEARNRTAPQCSAWGISARWPANR